MKSLQLIVKKKEEKRKMDQHKMDVGRIRQELLRCLPRVSHRYFLQMRMMRSVRKGRLKTHMAI